VLQAALEVDNAAIGVVKSAEQTRLLEETVVSARRALEIANTSYKEGYADFQRVLDAQRSLLNQENRLVSSRGEHISHLISLYKGLGGGWSVASLETLVPEQSREKMKRRTNWG
jgi:outer membrane protein TolC